MRSKRKYISWVALAAGLALVGNFDSQLQAKDFRIEEPLRVTNQDGQEVLLVGMEGNLAIFQFEGMAGAEASVPIEAGSRIRFSYPYPRNFNEIQSAVLNNNFDRALRLIRTPPIDLLRFLAIPEGNSNFHLYGEIYYRALAFAGDTEQAVAATAAIPWGSRHLPNVFRGHAATLLNRIVGDQEIESADRILSILQEGLPTAEFSSIALPVADKLRLLGQTEIVESIYNALSQSTDEETRTLGLLWSAYNQANTGQIEAATDLLNRIGEITEESPLFPIYCLAHGRLAMAEEQTVPALRFLSRAMVRTSIADSYKPEIYFLMIRSYMMDEDLVPARRLAREMAVFYPANMWLQSITERYPQLRDLEQPNI